MSHSFPESSARRLLCVDDEKVGLAVRRILLEANGYNVLTAEGGPQALVLFDAHPVDAVILDYSMPGMDGAQVAAEMRQRRPETPILLLSAYVTLPDEVMRLVDLSLTKGDGAPVLLETLERLFTGGGRAARGASL
jgi:CheY-like chemotaxis protein